MKNAASGLAGWIERQSIQRRLGIQSAAALILGVLIVVTVGLSSLFEGQIVDEGRRNSTAALAASTLEKDFASLERDVFRHALLQTAETEESYLGNVADFEASVDDARQYLDAEDQASLDEVLLLASDYVGTVTDVISRETIDEGGVTEIMDRGDPVDAAIETVRDSTSAQVEILDAQQAQMVLVMLAATLGICIVSCGGAYWLARTNRKLISREMDQVRSSIAAIEAGNLTLQVPLTERTDEIGELARAAERLRDARQREEQQEENTRIMVAQFGNALREMADGDLTVTLSDLGGEYEALRADFNATVLKLRQAMASVAETAASVKAGSGEISEAADDLALRTQGQASDLSRLNDTVTSISQVMSTTADAASNAASGVESAVSEARHGGEIVSRAVSAMGEIERSTSEIGKIISVIDGISFQTNLLALNAGVEAARAGEVGRGFAVVAGEVRALAQRSTQAAEDIRALIGTSTQEVASGARLVRETGEALDRIIEKIFEVTAIANQISSDTRAQSGELTSANELLTGIDHNTQQNAAMVEQSTAAARSLASEADNLTVLVQQFRLGQSGAKAVRRVTPAARPVVAAPPPMPRPARIPATQGNAAIAMDDDDWSEF